MKTAYKLTIVSSLLLVAGCSAWHERHAKNQQTYEPYSSASTSGSSFQPGATQSTTSGTSAGAAAQTQTFAQGGGGETEFVTQVQKQLTQDPALAPLVPNLQISFQNDTVVLAGNVPSEQEKQKIETIVKSTTGVVNVNNQLQVSTQSQLNLPGATENKQAVGGTSDQSTTTQSTGNQSSPPEATPRPRPSTRPTSPTGPERPPQPRASAPSWAASSRRAQQLPSAPPRPPSPAARSSATTPPPGTRRWSSPSPPPRSSGPTRARSPTPWRELNVRRKAKHRGLAIPTLLIAGLSCPAISASAAGSQAPVRARPVTSGPGHLILVAGVVLAGAASEGLALAFKRRRPRSLPPRGSRPLQQQRARTGER